MPSLCKLIRQTYFIKCRIHWFDQNYWLIVKSSVLFWARLESILLNYLCVSVVVSTLALRGCLASNRKVYWVLMIRMRGGVIFTIYWAEAHLVLGWLSFIVCRAVRTTAFCYGGQDDEEDNGWDHPTEHRHDQDKIRVEIIMDLVEDFIERILISFLTAELIRP